MGLGCDRGGGEIRNIDKTFVRITTAWKTKEEYGIKISKTCYEDGTWMEHVEESRQLQDQVGDVVPVSKF
jgi:hypothetical protein